MSQKVLSDEAQKAIDIATEYAQDNNHNQLDGAHILWSILKYTEFGQDWLNINNVDISIVQKLEDSLGFWYRNDSDQTQASSTYIRIMQTAFANSSNAYITVTHLLHVVIEVDTELMAWLSENGIQASTMVLPASTPRLNEFGRDITRLARQGKLPIVIGREEEQQQITEILLRHGKNNVLLLGDPGVGKTSVIEQLAQNIVNGTVPEKLKRIRLVEISTNNLVSGTVYRGQFEERLSQILAEITEAKNIIIVIDEFHTLVGSGTTVGSSLDAANILKPALARGELTCIGITTYDDYSKHIKKDAALSRRFENVSVLEPSEEETRLILDGIVQQYEDHHSVKVETVALDMIVQLAARYLLSRRFPDKAIDILSRACSRAEIQNFSSVDSSIITSIVSELAGTPVMGQLESSMQQVLSNLQETLQQVVIGQEKAVNTVSQAIRLSLTGLRDSDRPKGVFMFVGPSGVGKTELAKSLAQI
jgi:ATP-dependent Clp protease ATP-binding subunit ClpC